MKYCTVRETRERLAHERNSAAQKSRPRHCVVQRECPLVIACPADRQDVLDDKFAEWLKWNLAQQKFEPGKELLPEDATIKDDSAADPDVVE